MVFINLLMISIMILKVLDLQWNGPLPEPMVGIVLLIGILLLMKFLSNIMIGKLLVPMLGVLNMIGKPSVVMV